MKKARVFIGLLTAGLLTGFTGCRNTEITGDGNSILNASTIMTQETAAGTPVKAAVIPDGEVSDVKADDEYNITGHESGFAAYVKEAGGYSGAADYFAFEEDFDLNGENEAFVIIGAAEEDSIKGDIWFVNYLNEATLLKEDVSAGRQQQIYRGKNSEYLFLSYMQGGRLITGIYYVFEDWTGEAFSAEEYSGAVEKYMKAGKLVMVQSAKDRIYDKETGTGTGLTLKKYYYEYNGEYFESVASEEKTEADFRTFRNATELLTELEKEYHPTAYQFICRKDGEWNVNIAIEDEASITFRHATYQTNEGDNTLTLREEGEGYYRLDFSNSYRDFLTLLLNEDQNNNLQTWLSEAAGEGMTEEEAQEWYQRFQEDNIFMDNGYISSGLQVADIDGNGEKDVFLLTAVDYNSLHMTRDPEFISYFYVYMNQDPVYMVKQNHYEGDYYHGWYQDIVSGDVDQDGYLEIGYNIFTGGNGGAGSSHKGLLKYRDNVLEEIDLPNDLEEYGDTGLSVQVLAGTEKGSYVAYCPYLEQKAVFSVSKAPDGSGNGADSLKEGEAAGGNVRGYYSLEVVSEDGREYLRLKEFLHGEGGINDGIGNAVFLIDWDEDKEPYVKEFSVEGIPEE